MSTFPAGSALPVILERLRSAHPNARYELKWDNPLQLLVATILAAQCTDERVNAVTPALFARYPDAAAFAKADQPELEELVRSTGFYRNKAKSIKAVAQALTAHFHGKVPQTMAEMVTLPGVARKTANVVLNTAFGIASGVIVDSHVVRVSRRLGLTDQDDPERIEADLMATVPREEWIQFGAAMVLHGRYTCTSRAPKCRDCILSDVCPKLGVDSADAGQDRGAVSASHSPAPERKGSTMTPKLPPSWQAVLGGEFDKPYFHKLAAFVEAERAEHQVFPPEEDVFNAFQLTPYDKVKVLLLGQDPYHDDGQAHGLCFSVRPGIKPPPSLVNIFKELHNDVGCKVPNTGCLAPWAEQGVMLLNAVLTVQAHKPASHAKHGWETFTDAAISALNQRADPLVFLLWGAYAQKKIKLIDADRHAIISSAHPSPLSASKFFGSRPFSAVNQALARMGKEPIDWQIPAR